MVENLPFYFQVGRTFFNCRYKKPQKLFQCCGVSERPNIFYYHKQNKMQVNEKTNGQLKLRLILMMMKNIWKTVMQMI